MSQQINLYNPIFLKQRKIFSALAMLQALGLIVVAAVGIAIYAQYQVRHLSAEMQRGEARLKAEEARLTRLGAEFVAKEKSADLEKEIKLGEAELKVRQDAVSLLSGGALGERTGVSSYLRAMARQTLSGLWLTGFELEGKEMTLSGRMLRAELLPEYLRRLGREQAMQGREFAMLNMQQPKPAGDKPEAPGYLEFSLRSAPPKQEQGK